MTPKLYTWDRKPDDIIRKEDNYLFEVLILAAKKDIAWSWLKSDPPRPDLWLDIVEEMHSLKTELLFKD